MVCAGALFLSLCQFLRDSCRLGDHTSIMYPEGEGAWAGAILGEIKEIIHPFYTTTGWGRIVHTDCGLGLRAGRKREGEKERGRGSWETRKWSHGSRVWTCRTIHLHALSHSSHHSWHFHKGQFVHQRIPRRLEAAASWEGGCLQWGCWVEQNSSHLTTSSIFWVWLAMLFATFKRSEVRLAGGALPRETRMIQLPKVSCILGREWVTGSCQAEKSFCCSKKATSLGCIGGGCGWQVGTLWLSQAWSHLLAGQDLGSYCCCSLGCESLALEAKCPRALGSLYSDCGMEASMEDSSHWLQSSVSPGVQLLGRVSEAPTFLEKSFPRYSTPQTLDSRGTFPNLWNQESRVPAPQPPSLTSRGPLLSSTLAAFLLVP